MPGEEKKKRARAIRRILEKLYPAPETPLEHRNPFELLVAVVLSAQCTDRRVNEVTPKLFRLADTPDKMRRLDISLIEKTIRSCGLSTTKSRAIRNFSQILCERYDGKVPQTFDELESLPGVGHKTASVVMAQAFGKPAFPVDTHIHRVARRWGLSNGDSVAKTEADLKTLFPKTCWSKLHLQMIYFAREHCPARGHDATKCPICRRFGTENDTLDQSVRPHHRKAHLKNEK